MNIKGFIQRKVGKYVYLKEFYTGLRYKVPADKCYAANTADGYIGFAERAYAVLM